MYYDYLLIIPDVCVYTCIYTIDLFYRELFFTLILLGLGFRVWGSGVWGFRVYQRGLGFRGLDLGFGVWGWLYPLVGAICPTNDGESKWKRKWKVKWTFVCRVVM